VNPAGTRVYVANDNGDTVSVINTADNTVTATVAVGGWPCAIAVNPAGTRVYVANSDDDTISVIDTADNTVAATVSVGDGPCAIAVNPAGAFAYVANFGDDSVSVIDTADNTVTATVSVGNMPSGVAIGQVEDTTPPTVSSTTPANNATDVAVNSAITATFSEAMDSSTITTDTFLVSGSSNISGTVTYTDTTATFTPVTDLDYNTTYTATITTGAKDLAGNASQADYTWSFTTSSEADTTAPTVSSITPVEGATDVDVNTAITVTFSEAMDPSTITTDTFLVNDGDIAGTVTYSDKTATFTPTTTLDYATIYVVTITFVAKDLAGNALTSYTSAFKTQSETTGGVVPAADGDGDGGGCFISTVAYGL